jgi:hypothetical protein
MDSTRKHSSFRSTPTVQLIVFGSILMYSLNALQYLHTCILAAYYSTSLPLFFCPRNKKRTEKRTVRCHRERRRTVPIRPGAAVRCTPVRQVHELVLQRNALGPASQRSSLWARRGQRTVPSPRSWRASGATPVISSVPRQAAATGVTRPAGPPATARSVLSGPPPQRVEVEAGVFRLSDDAGILLRRLVLFSKFTLNFTM